VAQQETTAQPQTTTTQVPRRGEWVIAGFMLAFFVFGYVAAQDWPFRAALFPQIISTGGVLLSVFRLIGLTLETVRGRRSHVPAPAVAPAPAAAVETPAATEGATPVAAAAEKPNDPLSEVTLIDDEAEEDSSMEYIFASASGRSWLAALAWIVTFFIAFFVVGVFVAVPLFALIYLKVAGKASWLSAVIYAIVTGAFIYLLFREVVYLPLPTGIFPFMQF
jgi:hypothetical protein